MLPNAPAMPVDVFVSPAVRIGHCSYFVNCNEERGAGTTAPIEMAIHVPAASTAPYYADDDKLCLLAIDSSIMLKRPTRHVQRGIHFVQQRRKAWA